MNFKQAALAAAITSVTALGASGPASAYVYGASGLTIDNLRVAFFGPGTTVAVTRFDFNSEARATLNGISTLNTATCGGLPNPAGPNNCTPTIGSMDAAAANAPGGSVVRINNQLSGPAPGEFTFFGPGAGGNWSNADTNIETAELINGVPTRTHNIAESLLTTGTSASALSSIQSITGVTISFVVTGGPANFTLDFFADPDLFVAIFGELGGSFSAQANLNASITLNQNTGGTGFANWTPQGNGTGINDCTFSGGVTCDETFDTQDLNINVGTTANNTSVQSSWDPNVLTLTRFGLSVTGLTAGSWTLTLNEVKSDQLARTAAVPEPGSLALLGLGMMGLFATSRRRKLG